MSIDHDTESPLTPLGLQLRSTESLRKKQSPAQFNIPDAPAWLLLAWLISPFLLTDFLFGPLTHLVELAFRGNSKAGMVMAGALAAAGMG